MRSLASLLVVPGPGGTPGVWTIGGASACHQRIRAKARPNGTTHHSPGPRSRGSVGERRRRPEGTLHPRPTGSDPGGWIHRARRPFRTPTFRAPWSPGLRSSSRAGMTSPSGTPVPWATKGLLRDSKGLVIRSLVRQAPAISASGRKHVPTGRLITARDPSPGDPPGKGEAVLKGRFIPDREARTREGGFTARGVPSGRRPFERHGVRDFVPRPGLV